MKNLPRAAAVLFFVAFSMGLGCSSGGAQQGGGGGMGGMGGCGMGGGADQTPPPPAPCPAGTRQSGMNSDGTRRCLRN